VWEFQQKHAPELEVVTLLPGLIVGPTLVPPTFTSSKLILSLINQKYPGIPKVMYPGVDVRDVAFAHL
jgi:dihydroflavonol-4-reductase